MLGVLCAGSNAAYHLASTCTGSTEYSVTGLLHQCGFKPAVSCTPGRRSCQFKLVVTLLQLAIRSVYTIR